MNPVAEFLRAGAALDVLLYKIKAEEWPVSYTTLDTRPRVSVSAIGVGPFTEIDADGDVTPEAQLVSTLNPLTAAALHGLMITSAARCEEVGARSLNGQVFAKDGEVDMMLTEALRVAREINKARSQL